MNKARAMLDALMGPGRDELPKDEGQLKEKFKDRSVCKGFLIGLCPLDASLLGGKRNFGVCDKIHSEPMKDLFQKHPERDELTKSYEELSVRDLEAVCKECETHIGEERARIRTDVRRRKPPLPQTVNDRLSQMKREATQMVQKAEAMDDDQLREKETLTAKANEILKDREDLLEAETKKAAEAMEPEVVCEVCGSSYVGEEGNAAHLKFRIHDAYSKIRDRLAELKPRVEEWEKQKREKKDEEHKKKRREEFEKAEKGDKKKSRARSSDKDRKHSRSRGDRRRRSPSRSRRGSRSRGGNRGSRSRRERSRSRGGGRDRRSRSRRRR
mmetsp:Transcript_68349/g.142863  ORF Transcript_68349/g.142863 Transcript_68349/m.142863 type:complete len:327 (+) Transcript_68349:70-1050(+)